jgi:hypothetical protein
MLVGHISYDPQLGFSITSPFKKVGRGIATGARAAGRGVKKGAKVVGKVAYAPIKYGIIKPAEWLGNKITAPVRNRVQKIVHRRAAKLAFDRRKSTTPTPAEVSEARNWTRSKLRHELPHGPVLSVFADAAPAPWPLGDYELGVAPAVVAAAVPILVAFTQSLLSRFDKSGEAPANPQADAKADATAPDAPVPPGTVDLQPAQDAAQDVAETIDTAVHPGTVRLPGGMRVKKSHLMIGGAVLGGVILLSLLTRKS